MIGFIIVTKYVFSDYGFIEAFLFSNHVQESDGDAIPLTNLLALFKFFGRLCMQLPIYTLEFCATEQSTLWLILCIKI